MQEEQIIEAVTATIHEICGVNGIGPDQDFYDAGVASVQALPLLMELESRFDVAIPDDVFVAVRTPRQLSTAIRDLKGAAQ